jgi:hypothetical protein
MNLVLWTTAALSCASWRLGHLPSEQTKDETTLAWFLSEATKICNPLPGRAISSTSSASVLAQVLNSVQNQMKAMNRRFPSRSIVSI